MSCSAVPLPSPSFGRGKFRWSTPGALVSVPASIAALTVGVPNSARVSVGPPLSARAPRFALKLGPLLLPFALPKPQVLVALSRLFAAFVTPPAQFAPPLPSETIVLRRLTVPPLRLMLLPLGAELWLTVALMSVFVSDVARSAPPLD